MGKINDGHHEYIGSHVDKMEERLQSAFPGQSEDFYKYGKWGGGATSSDAFENLTQSEKEKINEYLIKNNL